MLDQTHMSLSVLALVLLTLVVPGNSHSRHTCIHDDLNHEQLLTPPLSSESFLELDSLSNKPWEPLRIHFDTSYLTSDPSGRSCRSSKQRVAVGSPPDTSTTCTDTRNDDCYRTCTSADVLSSAKKAKINKYIAAIKKHFEAYLKVKRRPLQLQSASCGDGDITIPQSLKDSVKTSADLVIMVTARVVARVSTGAYAAACELANGDNRPILGYVNFNVAAFDSKPDKEMEVLTMHEVTHVLGFSNGLYKYFMGPDGTRPRKLETTVRAINGHQAITTPRVVQWLREHLNCARVCGAPLEDHGGSGTAGSHWELAVFYGSYMCGVQLPEFQPTSLTGALLEDSGWYKTNPNAVTTTMTFGKNAGCDFVKGCAGYPPHYKCADEEVTKQCAYDAKGPSRCTLPFDIYFKVGCYFTTPLSFDQCTDSTPRRLRRLVGEADVKYGSSNSRCFSGDVRKKRYGASESPGARCYEFTCDHTHADPVQVTIGRNQFRCPKAGGPLPAFDPAHGLVGRLYCPPAYELCPPARQSCPSTCQDVEGACIDGKCYCPPNEDGHGDKCIRCPKCDAPAPTPTPRIPAPPAPQGQCVAVYKAKPLDDDAPPIGPCTAKNHCNHKIAVRVNCRHGKHQTITLQGGESRIIRCDSIVSDQDDLLLAMDEEGNDVDEWTPPANMADLADSETAIGTQSRWWGKKKKKKTEKKKAPSRRPAAPTPRPRPTCPRNPRSGSGEDGCYCNFCYKVREIRCD